MNPHPEQDPDPRLDQARRVLRQESEAIGRLADQIGQPFLDAVDLIHSTQGMLVVTGMGKAGLIGQKISATFASTGRRSLFLHPAEAVHGDLGRIHEEDVVLALSRSGTTEEVVRLLDPLKRLGARLIGVTESPDSPLGRFADICLDLGRTVEACPLGLAPTTSTSVMLALGDALAMAVMDRRQFSKEHFARFHPAGELGRRLLTVGEIMRRGDDCPEVASGAPLRAAVKAMSVTRAGAVSVVDGERRVVGLYTDGDLRRGFLEDDRGPDPDAPVDRVMNANPRTIGPDHLAAEALRLMKERQFDQIPVVDPEGRLVGLLDVQDLMQVGLI